jgi:anti-sigma regulatory factor (Ser/Thr protein kinase)
MRHEPQDITAARLELRARLNVFRDLMKRQAELEDEIKAHLRELAEIRQGISEVATNAAVRAAELLAHVEAHECRQRRGEALA